MRYILTIVFLFSFFALVSAQCDSTNWAKEGTYQLIKISGSVEMKGEYPKTPLTNDQLCLIESLREENEFTFYQLDAYTRIRIFPRVMPEKNNTK